MDGDGSQNGQCFVTLRYVKHPRLTVFAYKTVVIFQNNSTTAVIMGLADIANERAEQGRNHVLKRCWYGVAILTLTQQCSEWFFHLLLHSRL